MDVVTPQFLFGDVMHQRLFPKKHGFSYQHYNLAVPLSALAQPEALLPVRTETKGVISFYRRDHGDRQGGDLKKWLESLFKEHDVPFTPAHIVLVTMPRIFGYVFNPVSFWLCFDEAKALKAVACEVNNTFGQTHTYLCYKDDLSALSGQDVLTGQKCFHVSPFLKREGHYEFRFSVKDNHLAILIDYFDGEGRKELVTSIKGDLTPIDTSSYRKALWGYPLITFLVIWRIHFHALKLFIKGMRYIPKPQQLSVFSTTVKKRSVTQEGEQR
ncbi:MAG: DUF1365 domain-containing protein [Pseudobdellovibrionaceae bacterium]